LPGKESIYAYSIYLCAGVLTWIFFAEVLGRSVNIFIENANLLKKVLFPKICLPIIVIASASVHFCIVMVIFTLFLLITGSFPGWVVLTIIPLLLIQTAFAIGLGMFLATINVFYRDVQQGTNILVQFWFWFTPIVYVPDALPTQVKSFLEWNPLWPLAISYHRIFVDAQPPQWATLAYPLTFAVVFLLLGIFAFDRLKGEIVDEL
jgi:lipopolysaccharide transport system permease protein